MRGICRRALRALRHQPRHAAPERVRVVMNEANGFGHVEQLRGPIDDLPVGAGLPPTSPALTGSHPRRRSA